MIMFTRPQVNKKRIHHLNGKSIGRGAVIYWMSRDQRVNDNWALLHAAELASELETRVIVAFALTDNFPGATIRHYGFMLRGLEEVAVKLYEKNIPFIISAGNPAEVIASLVKNTKAGAVVTEFDPLKIKRVWKNELLKKIDIPLIEVDAHNIVPCRAVSEKQEFGAYTIRPKIKKLISEFMEEYPEVPFNPGAIEERSGGSAAVQPIEPALWKRLKKDLCTTVSTDAEEVDWLVPGEDGAKALFKNFLETRFAKYDEGRNDPNEEAVSGMSPYLHFGHLSSQRIALEILKNFTKNRNTEAYLEELITRKELSDNFCHFNHNYDSFEGFPDWAKKTLNAHRMDEREYIYSKEQFESGQTHDPLWNAAQAEMVNKGKMHGYMRMYWAKKILEWTPSPEEALGMAIYLNDKYELDGRDPNGYTGCAWSIGGVHDRAWAERPVFGKIRFMNANGCKRKFNTELYIKKASET